MNTVPTSAVWHPFVTGASPSHYQKRWAVYKEAKTQRHCEVQQHRVNVQCRCRSARRDWLGFILMGWFDRYCITLKALPIFPVTFCRRRTDRGKLPPPSPLLSTWRTLSALTHVDTRNIWRTFSSPLFKDGSQHHAAVPFALSQSGDTAAFSPPRMYVGNFYSSLLTPLVDTFHLFVIRVRTQPSAWRTSCRDLPADWEASLETFTGHDGCPVSSQNKHVEWKLL